ncbi:MAG: DUF3108 domain-containing protein [Sulfuricella sp.]|nr:DUF3108 domain-containing protein [Sulfuricella sp.]
MGFPDKKLLWALAMSLSLHVVLLSAPPFAVPESHAPRVLEARLTHPAPPPLPPPAKAQRKPRPRPAPVADVPPQVAAVSPNTGTATPAEPPPIAPPDAAPPKPAPPSPPETPQVAQTTLPSHAWLRFDVIKGEHGLIVGRAIHTWQRSGEAYELSSVTEATGPFSWFITGQHLQVSKGRIGPAGLQPESFRAQRGKTEKTDTAQFDWAAMTLHLDSEGSQRDVKLIPGVRDMLSFVYQFAFSLPEQGDIRVDLTNGRKLDSYRYRIVGEEDLETPLGVLKALHLTKLHNPGEEGTEIWLGMDYHYLPVKIRQIDKQGDRFEQAVAEIRY